MRQSWLICGLLMVNVLSISSQYEESMSNTVGKQYFEEMVRFVLSNGDRRTYCNMYNNNPHYSFDDVEIYLNPYDQWINYSENKLSYTVSDYNEMLIEDNSNKKHFRIRLIDEKIYMYGIEIDALNRLAEETLEKYLLKMISN
jgi:hypothetical protein